MFGYLKLAFYLDKDKNKYSGAWNFGPDHNQAISVNKVVKVLCSNFQYNKNIIYNKEKNNKNIKEAKLLSLDCSKSNKILKWKPILNSKKKRRIHLRLV